MFGTLVSTEFDRETLEYIENPDPVAAFSRNVQDTVRIACMHCRARKVRCSGGRKRCQRCVTMGLECVYPDNQGRNKRQENNKRQRAGMKRKANAPARAVCDDEEPCTGDGPVKHSQELALDDLQDNRFEDGFLDESLFSPWVMDTPMQQSLDGRSSSTSSGNPTPVVDPLISKAFYVERSHSVTAVPSDPLPELSMADTALGLAPRPSPTDDAGNLDPWEGPHMAHSDISWAMNTGRHGTVSSTSEPLPLESWGRPRAESDSCCLLSSVSFLEKLSSRSASRENRIDVLLADVRSSIETLAIFISCERCAARVEQNMLLAMAARQIAVTCGKMATCCKDMHLHGLGDTNSPRQKVELDAHAGPVDISVSTYRVNRRERQHLLESLVTLQIIDFQRHINTIKSRYRNRSNKGQAEALMEAENHVRLAQVSISSHA
ncbi:hypothetical protein BDV26DRAFT_305430 [Aspergillus bertholletiae]|uniref:Zn(2)-C6 fungal-type domain-containing protein n=1 Tax=Aspergillus bertholletiae TaxID=1226010 RepID=A0A5N7B657_9EURO|nr:hypothetical protein BDV26DRAFT_305430 [Aspergillus bertholletiae]